MLHRLLGTDAGLIVTFDQLLIEHNFPVHKINPLLCFNKLLLGNMRILLHNAQPFGSCLTSLTP